jgi:hypothetical protein
VTVGRGSKGEGIPCDAAHRDAWVFTQTALVVIGGEALLRVHKDNTKR